MKFKFPVWATLFTLIGVLILCGLGTWQLQRLQWKTALLAQIEAEYAKDPMSFELTHDNLQNIPSSQPLIRGFAEGIYLHDKEIFVEPRTYHGKPGYHVITPFETMDNDLILVNRGWIPLELKNGDFAKPGQPMIITGLARKPGKPNGFTPKNNPASDTWFSPSPEEIAAAKNLESVMPYIFYADDSGSNAEYPIAEATKWQPENNHLGYALFWFALAGTLLIIYYVRFLRK